MVLFRTYNLLEFKGKLQFEIRVNGFQNAFYAVALMFTYFRQNANIKKLITLHSDVWVSLHFASIRYNGQRFIWKAQGFMEVNVETFCTNSCRKKWHWFLTQSKSSSWVSYKVRNTCERYTRALILTSFNAEVNPKMPILPSLNQHLMHHLSYTKSRCLTSTVTRLGAGLCHLQAVPSQLLTFYLACWRAES